MAEEYVESILIRQDNDIHLPAPSFADSDIDSEFELEAIVKLVQIVKNVQNVIHNKHDYVFKIVSISKIQKENN